MWDPPFPVTEVVDNIDNLIKECNGLTLLHLNIRSIKKHWDELRLLLDNHLGNLHVLMLSEVNINDIDSRFELEGYNMFYRLRNVKRGGGLIMYVNESIQFVSLDVVFRNFEGIAGNIIVGNQIMSLLFVYRPSNNNTKNEFIQEIDKYWREVNVAKAVFIGDVNIDIMNDCDPVVQHYETSLAANGFSRYITGATREEMVGDKLTRSCIDHIYIRAVDTQIKSAIWTSKLSDHYLITAFLKLPQNGKRDDGESYVTKIDEKKLLRILKTIQWDLLLSANSCEILYNSLYLFFKRAYERAVFVKEKNNVKRGKKSWMTSELIEMMANRDRCFHKWKKCKNLNLVKAVYRAEYNTIRNNLNKKIKIAKQNYYRELLERSRGNLKETWQTINTIIGKKKKESVDQVINKFLGKNESSEYVANSFANVFVEEVENIIHNCDVTCVKTDQREKSLNYDQKQSIYIPPVDAATVKEIITEMNSEKQAGYDEIRVKDLQNIKCQISPVIALLINLSIKEGVVPELLKVSVVRPVYKKGSHYEYSNYRPIALLSVVNKIMERYVAGCLSDYLSKFDIISKNQFGFQKKKSTSDLLLKFSNLVNTKLNENFHVVCMFVDFTKAFDTLNHKKLLLALEKVGVRGPLLQWFKSYLKNRKLVVKIGNVYSVTKLIKSGVPQGSILGPLLYLIYVNGMTRYFKKCYAYFFADDSALVAVHKILATAVSYLQEDYVNLLRWTHDDGLIVNALKTKIVHISSPLNVDHNSLVEVVSHSVDCLHNSNCGINCTCKQIIESVYSHGYLGIEIDKCFSWENHIIKLCNRIRPCAAQLYHLKYILPYNLLRTVYISLVESIISYAVLAWGNASNVYINQISNLQIKILKTILPNHITEMCSSNELFEITGLLPVNKLFTYRLILSYYYSNEYKIEIDHNISTRMKAANNFRVPFCVNKYGERSLKTSVPQSFNLLPKELKDLDKISKVKLKVKEFLLFNDV